jgi:hypothetical protein
VQKCDQGECKKGEYFWQSHAQLCGERSGGAAHRGSTGETRDGCERLGVSVLSRLSNKLYH